MVGVFLIYLARTHAKKEVTIALPILNRTNRKFRETVGPFMNLLPVKFQYEEDWSLMEVVQEVKHKLFGVMRHQRYQYGYLLNDLNPDRPDDIYHVRLSYESFRFSNQMGKASCSAHALANHQEVDPLAVYIRDYNEDGFDVKFVYRRNYLIDEAIAAMSQGVRMILEAKIKNNNARSTSVSLMGERTISRIHRVSHGPEIHWKAHTFSALWQQQLERFGDNTAIESPQGLWTYGQVDEEIKKYAQFLVGNEGVQREGMIALLLPQTEQTVFVMLAGLMSGVAYIPLEPDNPIERHVAFLKQIGCTQLLTSREVLNDDLDLDINWIEDVVRSEDNSFSYPAVTPEQLAYVMQTSGSTGNPKGVPVTNRAVANYIQYFQQYFKLSNQDRVVQAASLGFDTSVEEIFPILISGGKLQLLQHRRDLNELSDCLKNKGVTLLSASPLVLDYLNQMKESYPSLRIVISGGDKLQYDHVRGFLNAGIDVYNTYGPTEATVCATYAKLDSEAHNSTSIGNPIANAATYLLNENHELLPDGVIGEIFIGGVGVSSGYLKNEKLNQQKFVAHPFQQDKWLYKSGDNGLRRHDGSIAFLGRNDNEVKIRGMRIDPDEIEGAVMAYPEVEHAVAVPNTDLTEILCFYTLCNSDQEKATEIRQFISKVLPPYMIPKKLILLDHLEINERGKVDRQKMRDQFVSLQEEEVLAPKTRHEERLLEIWKAVLELEEISTQSSFFEIGGHSISANKMINRINKVFGVELDLVDAFTYPTIGLLGAYIASMEEDNYDIIELC
jgi:amino acid adenylation domain-containing protein